MSEGISVGWEGGQGQTRAGEGDTCPLSIWDGTGDTSSIKDKDKT